MAMLRRVLLADDDPELRWALGAVLAMEGYDVVTASNGREALELLETPPRPSLVLLDWQMPVMDGRAFLDALAADPVNADLPVVVLTSASEPPAGARHVVSKAIDPDALVQLVRACVR